MGNTETNQAKSNPVPSILDPGEFRIEDDMYTISSSRIVDDKVPQLCELLASIHGKVKHLYLAQSKITSAGANILFNSLRENCSNTLHEINLEGNTIDDACMKSLGEFIQSSKVIKTICLDGNKITDHGVEILAEYIHGNTSLSELYLSHNDTISDKSTKHLELAISNSNITHFRMWGTDVTSQNNLAVLLVANFLRLGTTRIDFPERGITDDGIIAICKIFAGSVCDQITIVNLAKNNITSKGAIVLFDALKSFSSLKSIGLSGNPLDDDCMDAMGSLLHYNPTIQTVLIDSGYVGKNHISDKGVEILSQHLIGNTVLKILAISGLTQITKNSTPVLVNLATKSGISKIITTMTAIPSADIIEITAALNVPIEQRDIPIESKTKSAAKRT